MSGVTVRLGRVGQQIDAVDLDEVGSMVAGAELEGRIARNFEVIVDRDVGRAAIEDAESRGWRQAGSQTRGDGRESHGTRVSCLNSSLRVDDGEKGSKAVDVVDES